MRSQPRGNLEGGDYSQEPPRGVGGGWRLASSTAKAHMAGREGHCVPWTGGGLVVQAPDYSAIHTLASDSLPHLLICSVPDETKYSREWGGEGPVCSPVPL